MSEIYFLGTSGALASKKRGNTSLLICESNEKILIDCPGSPVAKLDKLNVDSRKIKHIIFTHAHPDHVYGIISLLYSQYRLKNKLNIYAHPKVITIIKKLREVFKLKNQNKFPEINFVNIAHQLQTPLEILKNLSIYTFKVKHNQESLGLKFKFKKNILVYSSDTALSNNLIKVSTGTDYLIHDCFGPSRFFNKYPKLNNMHTSSLSLGKIAKECKVKTLIPIHFAQEVKYSMKEVKEEIKKNYEGKVVFVKDFDKLKLTSQHD